MTRFDSSNATLRVKTYREGVAAKAGHDLIIEVTGWEATLDLDAGTLEFTADPRSLEVREGLRGVKPLTDKDRAEIKKIIEGRVLGTSSIQFRSTSVEGPDDAGRLTVSGDLGLAGQTRPTRFELALDPEGKPAGKAEVKQTDWGIKPYKGLMGALKVRDVVEVVVE
jgi:polyisoprenoid-binding protein YceI